MDTELHEVFKTTIAEVRAGARNGDLTAEGFALLADLFAPAPDAPVMELSNDERRIVTLSALDDMAEKVAEFQAEYGDADEETRYNAFFDVADEHLDPLWFEIARANPVLGRAQAATYAAEQEAFREKLAASPELRQFAVDRLQQMIDAIEDGEW